MYVFGSLCLFMYVISVYLCRVEPAPQPYWEVIEARVRNPTSCGTWLKLRCSASIRMKRSIPSHRQILNIAAPIMRLAMVGHLTLANRSWSSYSSFPEVGQQQPWSWSDYKIVAKGFSDPQSTLSVQAWSAGLNLLSLNAPALRSPPWSTPAWLSRSALCLLAGSRELWLY